MSLITKIKEFLNEKLDALEQLETTWINRPYDFYLIFGQNEESKFPWIKSNWDKDFKPYFDSLLKQTETYNKTGIRVIKYDVEKRTAKKDNREYIYHSEMKLGRLRWDLKSHEKWTNSTDTDKYFQNFELWTPIWTICEKKGSPPDIFISISNENDFTHKRQMQFGYFIVIAIAKNLKIDSEPVIKELSEKINAKISILKRRKWGKPEKAGNWTFVNWIQDTFSTGIYKGKNLHSVDFNELEFEPTWKILFKQK